MPFRAAKDPAAVYADVADAELVLVPDAPFASAVNRRLTRPYFGTFATTPRRHAAGRRERAEDRTAFLHLIDETDHGWRALAYTIGNVLQCWEHRGAIDAILDYPAYVDPVTRDVVDALAGLPTTSGRLQAGAVETDGPVAVVGHELLTPLERRVVPPDASHVDLFAAGFFDLPDFHVFDSKTEIVTAVLDSIDAADAERVAIVLDGTSQYSTLVEAGLAAADVPFVGGPGFVDDPDHRALLGLFRTAFRGRETTVGDVAPVLAHLGEDVPIAHHEKRLDAVDTPATAWLESYLDDLETVTFGEALVAYVDRTGRPLEAFRRELEDLGLADVTVSDERVGRLTYYLQTYEVPVEREHEGVLLVDATSSAYVDRPVVFFLGLDEGWVHAAPRRPWIDSDAQFDRQLAGFERLLQSGDRQYYLVQDTAAGEPVTPCLYFDALLEQSVDRFDHFRSRRHRRRPQFGETGFDRSPLAVEPTERETISQSSLATYVNCPRDYFFSRLLDGPERAYLREGTLFHEFAAFYASHPTFASELELDELAAFMLGELDPFVSAAERPLRRRRYRIGLALIREYLDDILPDDPGFLSPADHWGTNAFAARYGRPADSRLAERWFEHPAIGAEGKIDLVASPTELVDFKSSRQRSARTVVRNAAIEPPADTPDFQAPLYLAHYRTVRPDEPLSFTFLHFLEPLEDAIVDEADVTDALTTVQYHPYSFDAYVRSRAAYDTICDGYTDCRETFDALGWSAYRDVVVDLCFPETTDIDELRDSAFADAFTAAVRERTPDDVDATKGADQALRALLDVRTSAFFGPDLDGFEAFLADQLETLNRRQRTGERFPIDGPGGEPNYRRVDHRDLLLRGDRR